MNREQADEYNTRIAAAIDKGNAELVIARIQRGMSRWDLFTMYWWKAFPYLKLRLWRHGFIWIKTAFYFLFFKQRTRWE